MNTQELYFTVFIIVSNTIVQIALSKKSMKLFFVVWTRDILSALMFIHLGMYWQVYIILWQFMLTVSGYFCWQYENTHGVSINQLQLLKIKWRQFSHTIAKFAKQKQSKT